MALGEQVSAGPARSDTGEGAAHSSAMRERFSWLAELAGRYLFRQVVINEASIDKIKRLAERGTVVYVLRQRSLIDYVLLNFVLRREGLPLPVFANGVSASALAPLGELVRVFRAKLRRRGSGRNGTAGDHDHCANCVAQGRPVLIFMRGRRGSAMFSRPARSRVGADFLREVVSTQTAGSREKFIVPLALFRGHSFKRRVTGLSAVVYNAQEYPSDTRKLFTYWWNRRNMFFTVGNEVVLSEFIARYHDELGDQIVRRLSRAIQIFLAREERVVLGPALLPRREIKAIVLESEEMSASIRELAEAAGTSPAKLRKEADGYFEEMAANFNGPVFGVIAYLVKKVWDRIFSGIETIGFEGVVDKARNYPVVLVPCHRSYLDFVIVSYLFHLNFVSPPHIMAGVNMAFWPMSTVFRAAGAFFVRRSFKDNELYKRVFRQYLKFLIREGYTQEFFIEGGRSRTGKMLQPKLGMLSAIVDAFLEGTRKDLYLVPVSIHYGRIVEEGAYEDELRGGSKQTESIGALLRARRFLQQRYGTVYMSFGEPMSFAGALGEQRTQLAEAGEEAATGRRRFVQKLGFEILRKVNAASVAGATSVSASVLLSAPHSGQRYQEYAELANALARQVKHAGVRLTASLDRNIGDFRESLGFLSSNHLIDTLHRGNEEILVVPESKRLALDFYKNNLIHVFLIPSLVASGLVEGRRTDELEEHVSWWLDLLRYEFPLPKRETVAGLVDEQVEFLRKEGALGQDGLDPQHPQVRAGAGLLDSFRESYWTCARRVRSKLTGGNVELKEFLEDVREHYEAGILLGELSKPEGNNPILYRNALARFEELGYVGSEDKGKRERVVTRGPGHTAMDVFVERLAPARAKMNGR